MLVEKLDFTFKDIDGPNELIRLINVMVERSMPHPDVFEKLGMDPQKGVPLYGPPGTGKTLIARVVANSVIRTFIGVIGSELCRRTLACEPSWCTTFST